MSIQFMDTPQSSSKMDLIKLTAKKTGRGSAANDGNMIAYAELSYSITDSKITVTATLRARDQQGYPNPAWNTQSQTLTLTI